MRSPNRSALLHAMIVDLEGVDILPDRMVRLAPCPSLGSHHARVVQIPILPAEPLRAGGARLAQLGRSPVGTGPFRVAAWERGKRIKLVRARAQSSPDGPLLDGIDFEIDADPARALTRVAEVRSTSCLACRKSTSPNKSRKPPCATPWICYPAAATPLLVRCLEHASRRAGGSRLSPGTQPAVGSRALRVRVPPWSGSAHRRAQLRFGAGRQI